MNELTGCVIKRRFEIAQGGKALGLHNLSWNASFSEAGP